MPSLAALPRAVDRRGAPEDFNAGTINQGMRLRR